MYALSSVTQHSTGVGSQCNKARKNKDMHIYYKTEKVIACVQNPKN